MEIINTPITITYCILGKHMTAFEYYENNRKLPLYEIVNQQNELIHLGIVKYNSRWRKYCFYPEDETVFDDKCLQDMINFLNCLNNKRKEGE